MPTVITYQEGDAVAVVHPAPGQDLEKVIAQCVPEGTSFAVIDSSSLPDRYFRNAWEYDGPQGVKVNVEKAKDVQRDVWRRIRKPKLEALDVELMQAVESASTAKRREVAAKKQALRDVTTHPLPDDLEGIKATIPDVLL